MKLKDLFGMDEDRAEQLKDVAFGFALGFFAVLMPLVFLILLRAR